MLLNIGGTLAGALGAFAAALLAARFLGRAEFAAFGVGLAFHSLVVQLSDVGFGAVTIAETAGGGAGRLLSSATVRSLARSRLGSATSIGLLATAVAVAVPPMRTYAAAVAIGSVGSVLASMTTLVVALLQATTRFTAAAAVLATLGFARLAGVAAGGLLTAGELPLLLAYAAVAPVLAGSLGLVLLRRRARPEGEQRPDPVQRTLRRAMFVAGVASAFLLNGDVILLMLFGEEADVGIYVAAWRVAAGVLLLTNAISYVVLVHAMQSDDTQSETRRIVRVGLATMTGTLLLAPVITLVGIRLLGDGWSDATTPLAILLVAFGLDAFVSIGFQAYVRAGRPRLIAATTVLQLATMAAVTLLLLEHGAVAPAIGQLVARIVGCTTIVVPLVLARRNHIDWFRAVSPGARQ